MKRQRLFCRCAAVVAQVVVDKETHLQLSMTAIDGGEGQLLGQTRKSARLNGMSVLPPTADVVGPPRRVRVVPIVLQKSKIERRQKSRKR
jgi:hypothetical protein